MRKPEYISEGHFWHWQLAASSAGPPKADFCLGYLQVDGVCKKLLLVQTASEDGPTEVMVRVTADGHPFVNFHATLEQ